MKPTEREIISHLRKGKRVNISRIARNLGAPITTIADRIKRIEQKYVIKRSSLLDYNSVGYQAHEMMAIKTPLVQKGNLFNFLKQENCVNSVYTINSDFAFLIEVVCKDRLELVRWTELLKQKFPVEMVSYQILKTEEKEKFVP